MRPLTVSQSHGRSCRTINERETNETVDSLTVSATDLTSPAASPRERRHRVIAAKAEEANCGARRWKSAQDVHRPAASSKMPGDGALTLLEDL